MKPIDFDDESYDPPADTAAKIKEFSETLPEPDLPCDCGCDCWKVGPGGRQEAIHPEDFQYERGC